MEAKRPLSRPSDAVFADRWKLRPLLLCHLVAVLFLWSLYLQAGLEFWRGIDIPVFEFCNVRLGRPTPGTAFWAWANTRWKDLLAGGVMLGFLVFPHWGFRPAQLQKALVGFLTLMLFLLPFRLLIYETAKRLEITGPSPTRVLPNANLVTELFPDIPTKDGEGRSFPGDHATVMLVWAGFILSNDRRLRVVLSVIVVTGIFTAPRVVVGSHWLSDLIVGGFAIALPVLAWSRYSPWPHRCCNGLHRRFTPLFKQAARIPILERADFFRAASDIGP